MPYKTHPHIRHSRPFCLPPTFREEPPKHGSWLKIAENELSSRTRQCVADQRLPDEERQRQEATAWSTDINSTQRGVDWQMTTDDARIKLKSVYPRSLS